MFRFLHGAGCDSVRELIQAVITLRIRTKGCDKSIKLHFIDNDENKTVTANIGENLLELAHRNGIDLEGACEASLACSTCHVILDEDHYNKLGEPSDEESDMLDLAFGLTETSRLGCQVVVDEKLDGMTIKVPSATRNVQVEKLR